MTNTDTHLVQAHALTVARGGVPVLTNVGFSLAPGEVLVLRGPNGSGKTTLLRTIAGLQPAMSGTLTCDPDDIAYGGHADGIKAALTVAENLDFWAAIYGQGAVDSAVVTFDLRALLSRPANNLSAGQKRRLGLARLLVTGRRVWVLDEPTVSLDQESTKVFAQVIDDHLSSGGAAIIATHIDLGIDGVRTLDVAQFKAARSMAKDIFDEAFG